MMWFGVCEFELVMLDVYEIYGIVVQCDVLQFSVVCLGCMVLLDWKCLGQVELLKVDYQGLEECCQQIVVLLILVGQVSGV